MHVHAGAAGAFVDRAGAPLFAAAVEEYMRDVRAKLLQWSARLLAQVRPQQLPCRPWPVRTWHAIVCSSHTLWKWGYQP